MRKIPREVCSASPIHIFQRPKLSDFWPVVCALFCIFIFGILHKTLNLKGCYLLLTSPPFCFVALSWPLLAIKLFSSFYTHFQLFVLNPNFLHCLELIDVFSANECSEMFACINNEIISPLHQPLATLFWLLGQNLMSINCELSQD